MYGVELVEAFPKTIGAQTLDYSATDQIHKLTVGFSYRWWKNISDEPKINEPVEEVSTTTPPRVRDELSVRRRDSNIINERGE